MMYRANGQPFWAMLLSVPLTQSMSPRKGKSLIRKREGSHAYPKHTNLREVKPKLRAGHLCNSHLCILFDVGRKHLKKIGKWTMGKVRLSGSTIRTPAWLLKHKSSTKGSRFHPWV